MESNKIFYEHPETTSIIVIYLARIGAETSAHLTCCGDKFQGGLYLYSDGFERPVRVAYFTKPVSPLHACFLIEIQ